MAEITPALTPEEWAEFLRPKERVGIYNVTAGDGDPARLCHQTAAMNLHGQPFGFTHEMLALLRRMVRQIHDTGSETEWLEVSLDEAERATLRAVADRIAALLPPEDRDRRA